MLVQGYMGEFPFYVKNNQQISHNFRMLLIKGASSEYLYDYIEMWSIAF